MIGGKAGVVFNGEVMRYRPKPLTMKQEIEMIFEACGEKLRITNFEETRNLF